MQKITPFLWFDGQAEDAAAFYVSIFPNSRLGRTTPGPDGRAMTVEFELDGLAFIALNGGPHFKFTEAVSFSVPCEDQAQIDAFWEKLTANGGAPGQCGWLKDRFGLSWQIVPKAMPELLGGDPQQAGRAAQAMMQMTKLDIAELRRAREG